MVTCYAGTKHQGIEDYHRKFRAAIRHKTVGTDQRLKATIRFHGGRMSTDVPGLDPFITSPESTVAV